MWCGHTAMWRPVCPWSQEILLEETLINPALVKIIQPDRPPMLNMRGV